MAAMQRILKINFHLARHVMTRYNALPSPGILEQEKVVTCCVALSGSTARRASRQARRARLVQHVLRGVATVWTVVDMSISPFPEVVLEIDEHAEHKRLNLYTRALLLLRRPPCLNKHSATRTRNATRVTRRACRVVT